MKRCRLCLLIWRKDKLRNIFKFQTKEIKDFKAFLFKFMDIDVCRNDDLPKHVCGDCVEICTDVSIQFQAFLENQKRLRSKPQSAKKITLARPSELSNREVAVDYDFPRIEAHTDTAVNWHAVIKNIDFENINLPGPSGLSNKKAIIDYGFTKTSCAQATEMFTDTSAKWHAIEDTEFENNNEINLPGPSRSSNKKVTTDSGFPNIISVQSGSIYNVDDMDFENNNNNYLSGSSGLSKRKVTVHYDVPKSIYAKSTITSTDIATKRRAVESIDFDNNEINLPGPSGLSKKKVTSQYYLPKIKRAKTSATCTDTTANWRIVDDTDFENNNDINLPGPSGLSKTKVTSDYDFLNTSRGKSTAIWTDTAAKWHSFDNKDFENNNEINLPGPSGLAKKKVTFSYGVPKTTRAKSTATSTDTASMWPAFDSIDYGNNNDINLPGPSGLGNREVSTDSFPISIYGKSTAASTNSAANWYTVDYTSYENNNDINLPSASGLAKRKVTTDCGLPKTIRLKPTSMFIDSAAKWSVVDDFDNNNDINLPGPSGLSTRKFISDNGFPKTVRSKSTATCTVTTGTWHTFENTDFDNNNYINTPGPSGLSNTEVTTNYGFPTTIYPKSTAMCTDTAVNYNAIQHTELGNNNDCNLPDLSNSMMTTNNDFPITISDESTPMITDTEAESNAVINTELLKNDNDINLPEPNGS